MESTEAIRSVYHPFGRGVEMLKRSELMKFAVLSQRWIAEDPFSGLGRCDRLNKYCEPLQEDRDGPELTRGVRWTDCVV